MRKVLPRLVNAKMDKALQALLEGPQLLAGVDEAGRGPWVGPVVAAAVILDPMRPILGLADSKKLTEKKRESLALEIKACALSYCVLREYVTCHSRNA